MKHMTYTAPEAWILTPDADIIRTSGGDAYGADVAWDLEDSIQLP